MTHRTTCRIHRFWKCRLLAGGVLAVGLFILGASGCEKSKDGDESEEASAESAADESPEQEPSDESEGAAAESGAESEGDDEKPPVPGGTEPRTFEFTYEATVKPGDATGPVDVFLPVATDTDHQKILEKSIDAPIDGEIREEETYGNKYWHASMEELPDEPVTVEATYTVRRQVFRRENLQKEAKTQFEENERDQFELFLEANKRVPTDGEVVEDAASEIGFDQYESTGEEARAIYDYVVDEMEYKKVGEGWGNGDTYWACDKKYGNCTDFHALYTSLARYRGIPSRFEIGFPVPTDRKSGKIGGYHCWLDFYLPGVGWTPIDASEASKAPEHKDLYYGTHPADRIQFSVGRDLKLGDAHDTKPLNYFVYPMVEVGEERYDGVETEFSYAESSS
jgi:transglutaminase-like putative cysteine protease